MASKSVPQKISDSGAAAATVNPAAAGVGGGIGNNKVAPTPSGEKTAAATDEADKPEEKNKEEEEEQQGTAASQKSLTQKEEKKMKNGCQKCCGKIMAIFARDAIYGSFVGPHPVSFLFCCALFKTKCPSAQKCSRPFCVASIATKIMNFIMFGLVALLAGFFVIPWPEIPFLSRKSTAISRFYPCQAGKMIKYKEANGGCENHAGYFMAYRCFFAYATAMLTNFLLMIGVSNTRDDPYRKRIHHGFWMYKYLYLIALLFIYFFMVNGERDKEGVFEFAASVIGNIAHLFFSLIEITFVMDLVELWVYDNKTGGGKWSRFIYWSNTFLIYLVSTMIYVHIWADYSSYRVYFNHTTGTEQHEWPDWPDDNCIEGEKRGPDWKHTGLILASTTVIMLLIIVMGFRKMFGVDYRLPYTGWLQAGVMILFNLIYLWSALTNSSNIHSRPHCNGALNLFSSKRQSNVTKVRSGSYDQYFGISGLFHGVCCILTLLYFAFVHGPRSNTAPLSMLYAYAFQIVDRIPVYPDEDDEEMEMPIGFLQAIDQSKVWDDEQTLVAQSWSLFYFMMIIGALSLMMAMTNFTNPWAADHYNSSNVASYCKFGTAVIATYIYIMLLISNCGGMREYGERGHARRKRSVREILEFQYDTFEMDSDVVTGGEGGQASQKNEERRKSEDVKLEGNNEVTDGGGGGVLSVVSSTL